MTDTDPRYVEPAEQAYQGYAEHTGGKTFDGRDMPAWADLGERIQGAWRQAVLHATRTATHNVRQHYMDALQDHLHDIGAIWRDRHGDEGAEWARRLLDVWGFKEPETPAEGQAPPVSARADNPEPTTQGEAATPGCTGKCKVHRTGLAWVDPACTVHRR